MTSKQLATLFACGLVSWTLGQSLFALLPVLAARLGANSAEIGNYLSSSFVGLTAGTLIAGKLLERVRRPRAIIVCGGILEGTSALLIGRVDQFWQLIVLTASLWLAAGIAMSVITILAGMSAGERERGKVFGILGMGGGLGGIIGGVFSGPIVDRWGFTTLFTVAGLIYWMQPLIALFITVKMPVRPTGTESHPHKGAPLGGAFYLLFVAAVVAAIPGFIAGLARPLQMDQLKFDASAISSIVSVGGAVSLPFPLVMGWLSDRLGRYRVLGLCIIATIVGMGIQAWSIALWQFWLSGALIAIGNVFGALGPALVGDLVKVDALADGLAQFGATTWIGGVIGLMGAGYLIAAFGFTGALLLGVILAVASIVLLAGTRRARARQLAAVPTI